VTQKKKRLAFKQLKFDAIFFDLFNTLLGFDFSHLSEVEFNGEIRKTSSVEIYRQLRNHFSVSFSYQSFFREFIDSQTTVSKIRRESSLEISALKRFQIIADNLRIVDEKTISMMLEIHMDQIFKCMYLPKSTKKVLNAVSSYPLVLVSNFDHAPTVWRALQKFDLKRYFEAIFISDEVGWRKPGERLFKIVLKYTQYRPEKCLWVGDDPEADVEGASRAGFQVAWLPQKKQCPEPSPSPRWVLRDLTDILEIVS